MEHRIEHYTIPKGVLLWKPYETPQNAGYEDLGNCNSAEFAEEIETKEHFSSRTGLKNRDQLVNISLKANGTFVLDELTPENYDKFFMGDGVTETAQSAGAGTPINLTIKLDRWYYIGAVDVSNVVAKNQAETVIYTEGADEDYLLMPESGMIFFRKAKGTIADDAEIHITSFDKAAATLSTVDGGAGLTRQGWIQLIADPAFGQIVDIKGFGSLVPEGSYQAISDDYGTLTVKIEMVKQVGSPLIEVRHRGEVAAS